MFQNKKEKSHLPAVEEETPSCFPRREKAITPKFRGKNYFELEFYQQEKYYSLKMCQSRTLSLRIIKRYLLGK